MAKQKRAPRSGQGLKWLILSLKKPASHMGTDSHSNCNTSDPLPYWWPGKIVKDGPKLWGPTPAWEI